MRNKPAWTQVHTSTSKTQCSMETQTLKNDGSATAYRRIVATSLTALEFVRPRGTSCLASDLFSGPWASSHAWRRRRASLYCHRPFRFSAFASKKDNRPPKKENTVGNLLSCFISSDNLSLAETLTSACNLLNATQPGACNTTRQYQTVTTIVNGWDSDSVMARTQDTRCLNQGRQKTSSRWSHPFCRR